MDPDIPDASTIVRFSALVKKKVSVVPKNIMYNPNVKNFKKFSKVFLSIFNSFGIENCFCIYVMSEACFYSSRLECFNQDEYD